ncbi:MAG: hypothetical protein ABSB52_12155 [Acidimicrobiales bacterium]|jgi:hypothetical protein
MSEIQVVSFLIRTLRCRLAEARLEPERGDVAEKLIIVAVFVGLAITVGVIITKAVTGDANHISNLIGNTTK